MGTMTKIDWMLLARQRKVLAEITAEIVESTVESDLVALSIAKERIDALDGVTNLLYELAADAVDRGLATEEEAFLSAE